MTLVDLSDSEGMFGLLLDFVADERAECQSDPGRRRFLSGLLAQLRIVEARISGLPVSVLLQGLREVQESADPEFAGDPVMLHLQDFIEEVQGVDGASA